MADEAGKDRPQEAHSREYNELGTGGFKSICKKQGLTEFQTVQLDRFMARTAGIPVTDPRYDKELKILLRAQIDKTPVLDAMHIISVAYNELHSPHGPRARSKRGSN